VSDAVSRFSKTFQIAFKRWKLNEVHVPAGSQPNPPTLLGDFLLYPHRMRSSSRAQRRGNPALITSCMEYRLCKAEVITFYEQLVKLLEAMWQPLTSKFQLGSFGHSINMLYFKAVELALLEHLIIAINEYIRL
jgi:hypothetical protein